MSQLTLDQTEHIVDSFTHIFGEIIVRSTDDDYLAYCTRGTCRLYGNGQESIVGFGDSEREALDDFWSYAAEDGSIISVYIDEEEVEKVYTYHANTEQFVLVSTFSEKKHPESLGEAV